MCKKSSLASANICSKKSLITSPGSTLSRNKSLKISENTLGSSTTATEFKLEFTTYRVDLSLSNWDSSG